MKTTTAPAPTTSRRATSTGKLENPDVAWPTLALAAACLGTWAAVVTGALAGAIPPAIAVPLLAVAAYAAFTPMHDGSHKSVSRTAWINDGVGRLAGVLLMAPYTAFRFAHLRHHRHTNTAGRDPDLWSGTGPRWALPLRWATQDLHYYPFYFRHWSERPRAERVETVLTLGAIVAVLAAATASGHGAAVLLYWILPTRLAITALAFAFDYLPHVPHTTPSSEDRFRATSNLRLTPRVRGRFLTPLLLCQDYHLLHHLYPGVPFYRYPRAWRLREDELVARGATTRALLA